MGTLGPAGEWLQLSEHYRRMTDDELVALAQQPSELTEAAQQLLAAEVSQRKLTVQPVQPEEQPAPEKSDSNPNSNSETDPYAQDRELVELCTVWSLQDALQVQSLLDAASIPFSMGPEAATRADAVRSTFSSGVSVSVMKIGLPWAQQAMKEYQPANEPPSEKWDRNTDLTVHCPKCHSDEVVLDEVANAPVTGTDGLPPKYKWACDSCGNKWEDEGVED